MRVVEKIVIKGAREHNLKDFDLEIPRKKLVVVTGVSGSGKSSLAFDTIYAEGQRRYVESLSVYVRQFLEQMDKPDVESIEGLSPAISIEQKTTSHNPRSTVGTVTEVYNYLRLLFSRIGKPYCPNCGKTIASQSMQQMVDRVLGLPAGSRIELMSPIVRNRKGEYRKNIEGLIRDGYTRIKVNGMVVDLEREDITLDKRKKHTIEVVVDRLIVRDGITSRLADSMEVAGRLSNGIIKVECQDGAELIFNERLACVECGTGYEEITPAFFSFNSPEGACPECKGLGEKFHLDPELVVPDKDISLEHGAIAPWSKRSGRFKQILNTLSEEYGFSLSLPFKKLPVDIQDIIFNGSAGRRIDFAYARGGKKYVFTEEFEGVLSNLERCYREAVSHEEKAELHRYMNPQPCPVCKGSRLKKEALFIKVNGRSIHDIASMSANEALIFFKRLELSKSEETVAQRILKEIEERLGFLLNVGLDYISLSRPAGTLSGGEGQRIRLATQIGSNLAGVLYILDEPTIGLHQRDNRRLIKALKKLVDMGNTVIVVEHDEETIRSADFVVDMGPGAGEHGGEIIALGTASEIMQNPLSLTGRYLSGDLKIPVPKERKKPQKKFLTIKGASANNLKDIEARFPIGLMTCVTGVSGSGKSTLVVDTLYKNLARALYGSKDKAGHVASISGIEHIDKVIDIDQSPIGRTPRSNPATYTGLFAAIRELFSNLPEAQIRGYGPGRFSFNVKGGRCETCMGEGIIKVEMHFLPDVHVPCDECKKKRYNRETLDIRYKGKTIADCLDMTVTEALEFFKHIPSVSAGLATLSEVGLGYIRLGQSAATLSGGEAQRIKLAKELSKRATGRTMYILDEPTTGLHFADIQKLLHVLMSLRDADNTIVIIEHNLDVIKCADHIIDLGPEGGDAGGYCLAKGTPEEIASMEGSYTGAYLERTLSSAPRLYRSVSSC